MVNSALTLQVLPLLVLLGNTHLCVSMFLYHFSCHVPALLLPDPLLGQLEHLAEYQHFRTARKRCIRGKPMVVFWADISHDKEWPIWVHSVATPLPGVCGGERSSSPSPGRQAMLQTTGLLIFTLKGLDSEIKTAHGYALALSFCKLVRQR